MDICLRVIYRWWHASADKHDWGGVAITSTSLHRMVLKICFLHSLVPIPEGRELWLASLSLFVIPWLQAQKQREYPRPGSSQAARAPSARSSSGNYAPRGRTSSPRAARPTSSSHLKDTGAKVMDLDVSASEGVIRETVAQAWAAFPGGVDVVLNNAGYVLSGLIEELT